ncbi:hypothetical protein [Corynebacterium amycolatum]|uniref:hypothetical protein n=1 Tax=Corynebacterium amycolatum TaxID=43765 RepID=UPI000E1159B3|nr:hypothetical protein [Corynebacterium amycolatum]STB93120.1 Uncharacterised protein [Corynebacterium amycolatum]
MSTGAFIATNKKTFLGITAVAILYSAFGRMLMGSGTGNTLLGIVALGILFLITARRSVTLRDYGVRTARWVRSAIIAILGTSLVATAFIVMAMVIEQNKSGFYRLFDSFIVTSGPALFPDTNGELYMIEDSGQNYTTILLTALCVFLSFLMSTVAGTAIGAVTGAKGVRAGSITIGLALVALFLFSYLLDVTDSVPGAPWPAVPIFASIITVISAVVMAWALKEEQRPLPAVRPAFAEA